MKQILLSATLALSLALGVTHATELSLFSGKTYLGCLNCNLYDSNSIWDSYGDYGSAYSDKSIWSTYGTYGSKYSDKSPWNRYSSDAPVVVDRNGNFYGKFTCNRYESDRLRGDLLDYLCDNLEYARDNRREVYYRFFN